MGEVTDRGSKAGREARHSTTMRAAARVGLVAYGVVHILIGIIALQISWGGGGGDEASSSGALKTIADQPFGEVALWVSAFGLTALTLWQVLTAGWGFQTEQDPMSRLRKRLSALGRAVVYAVLAFSAAKIAGGSSSSGSGSQGGDSKEEGLTAALLSAPVGRVLVAGVGIAILVVAVMQIYRGVSESFTHDLQDSATSGASGSAVVTVGKIGYVSKGVAIGVVGLLFGWSAISYDPDKAGGLDDALQTVRDQPYGPYLLTLVAVGLSAFGLFCFAWARYVRAR